MVLLCIEVVVQLVAHFVAQLVAQFVAVSCPLCRAPAGTTLVTIYKSKYNQNIMCFSVSGFTAGSYIETFGKMIHYPSRRLGRILAGWERTARY